ncbi:MAG: helix-turn-helix transcriptional regulator [Clostridia bacterium]|nr:helix-turn-helix transcriptional regulator [Clostridia bacterium]
MFFDIFYRQKNRDTMTGKQHSHNNSIEIIQFISGEGSIILGDSQYIFSSGDVFCFDGLIPHYIMPRDAQNYVRNKLIINRSTLMLISEKAVSEVHYFHTEGDKFFSLDENFKLIYNLNQSADCSFAVLSEVFKTIDVCLGSDNSGIKHSSSKVQTVIKYINENLQNELSIDEIAAACYMSKYHMCRKFKEETGTTLGNYIKQQRIYLSKKLLAYNDSRISAVALEAGFSDASHFTKIFNSEVGLTPSQYKKLCLSNRKEQ